MKIKKYINTAKLCAGRRFDNHPNNVNAESNVLGED